MRPQFIIVLLVLVLSEFYFIQAIRTYSQDFGQAKKTIFVFSAYSLLLLDIVFIIAAISYPPPNWNNLLRLILAVLFVLILCKVFCFIVLFLEDISRFIRWIIFKLSAKESVTDTINANTGISRLRFMSQIALTLTIIPTIGLLYGMVRGAYKYRVHKVKVPTPNIPEAFNGFKIVQISDIHTGSFLDNSHLIKAFNIVMAQKADLILFTGDLVNNEAKETEGFEEVYKSLKAPHGVYSVLGNHDYGDYKQWDSPEEKVQNLDTLKKAHADAGWRLLMNEHVAIEKNGQKIALLGIENWGAKMNFPKYGKMDLAHKGTEEYSYKILMSHDPSHWEKQVQTEYPDVDLTLSGHTHGMQMGIEIPGIKWSPSQWFYKQWAGLYKQDNQFLYVNRGLGFLGYPGRLGIWPEITVIELQRV
jgi:uncharacterized protein